EAGHVDAGVPRQRPGGRDPFVERREAARVLERIAGRDEPPYAIEIQPLHRQQTGAEMRSMRRIEGAAEEPDVHSGCMRGKADHAGGRMVPTERRCRLGKGAKRRAHAMAGALRFTHPTGPLSRTMTMERLDRGTGITDASDRIRARGI